MVLGNRQVVVDSSAQSVAGAAVEELPAISSGPPARYLPGSASLEPPTGTRALLGTAERRAAGSAG